jgi:hypothetical protein
MPSSFLAELNKTLRAICANPECRKEITTETYHYNPDRSTWAWGLLGSENSIGKIHPTRKIYPTCNACYEAGWRPPNFEWMG